MLDPPVTSLGREDRDSSDFVFVRARRAAPILRALTESGSAVLLIGDAGSGKSYLAEFAARELETGSEPQVRAFVFAHGSKREDELTDIAEDELRPLLAASTEAADAATPAESARRLEQAAFAASGDAEPLFVLPGVDHYGPRAVATLEHLLRNQRVRIVATAIHMTGGASQMSRNPRVMRYTVGPLDLEEAGALIASVIGRGSLGHATLRRWHEETAGNSYALMMMLIANERAGTLQQRPTGAYVAADDEVIPEEFVSYLDQHCTDAERLALEIVALAHPFSSSALVHRADPDALATLLERSLLRSTFSADGASELRIATPLLAATVLSRISPSRREALYREFFESLTAGVRDDEFLTSRSLVQAVDYGLRLDLPLSEAWLNAAVAKLSINGDPQLLLRVSLRLARDFESPNAAAAAIRSVSIAQQLGRPADAQLAFSSIERLLNHPQSLRELGPELRVRLHLTQLERQFHNDWPMAAILEQLDRLAGSIEPEYRVAHEIIHSMRFRLVMRDGSFDLLDESWIAQPPHRTSSSRQSAVPPAPCTECC